MQGLLLVPPVISTMPSLCYSPSIIFIWPTDAPQSMDQYMELDQNRDQTVQNNSAEVRLPSRTVHDDRAVYRLDPLTSGMKLRPNPRPDFRTDRANFSKARIIQLSEDLGRISTLLDQATDCPDRPAFVQLHTAATSTWPDESGHQPMSHFDQI
ncbi:hypothetical protein DY000_02007976 [Brassica cretica]|uniref:Uncharacterized protein n=1 Tax=Brassica cretica TaxID=69181 RepID=A0ABQ7CCR1_BRACR|nr:hypothetical protein DY000_02007976 [Brassica cretica]